VKKYYDLEFDGVSYYEYSDDTKRMVRKVYRDDIDAYFRHVYFEGSDNNDLFTELGSGKHFKINPEAQIPNRTIDLGYATFNNVSLTERSRMDIIHRMRILALSQRVTSYSSLMCKIFKDSVRCHKLVRDNQVKVDRKSIKEFEQTTKKKYDSYTEARLLELQKEIEILK
jgi:hypothetical protein